MEGKSKLGLIVLITILLASLSIGMVAAQKYTSQVTTDVTIGSNGTFSAQESSIHVSYTINGTVGATGTVTANVYDGNPQPSAAIPSGISLTHFVVINFVMRAHDFISATVTLTYTDADVQNLKAPFAIYKYDVNSNSYIELPSTVDASAKTITITLNSIDDPLLAIGGTTATTSGGGGSGSGSGSGISAVTWIIVIVAIIIIVLVAVFVVSILRKPHDDKSGSY